MLLTQVIHFKKSAQFFIGGILMEKYWEKEKETMSRDQIFEIQSDRLQALVQRVYDNVPYYKQKMIDKGVEPGDVVSVSDLNKLPFTTKQDLRDTYPFGLFAKTSDEIVRIHASSGTTGKQTIVGYTKNDIKVWANLVARCLSCADADKNSTVQVAYGYGLFTGGLGIHYGTEMLGATVIPVSAGNTSRQIQMMMDLGSTHIACTPSYALYLAETIAKEKIDMSKLKLRAGIFGAEPWTENMRNEIEQRLKIKAYDIYGLSEVMGPGVSCGCDYNKGLHIWEDHFIPEIIDPDTGETLPAGSKGELLFTTITKEGLPLIRYRTKDISSLDYEICDCGRTMARMSKVTGRTDDMLIIRGVNVFPSQIESVILEFDGVEPHYQLIVDRIGNLDTLSVEVEMTPELFSDEVRLLEEFEETIKKRIEAVLGISARVKLVEPLTITRSEGKAKRVIDNRKML
jgi:phenylacetate-CoA ligase